MHFHFCSADLIDSDENLHCFKRPLSSCYIKISFVSQCRSTAAQDSPCFQYMNTHQFAFFFDLQLAPAGLLSDLVTARLSTEQPSHDDTMRKKCYLRDFEKPPNQNSIDIPMQTSKAFFCRKLKIINECTSRSNMP